MMLPSRMELNSIDRQALQCLRAGEVAQAVEIYQLAVRRFPASVPLLCNLGVCLRRLNDHDAALDCYWQALQLEPEAPDLWSNQGNVLRDLGRQDDALRCYERALHLADDFPAALIGCAHCFLAGGRPHLALPSLRSVMRKHPERRGVRHLLAAALLECMRQNKPPEGVTAAATVDEAERLLNEVLCQENPQAIETLLNLAHIRLKYRQDIVGARQIYAQVLSIRPNAVPALQGLAEVAAQLGERELARGLFSRLAVDVPQSSEEWTDRLFALNYDPKNTPQDVFAATCGYGDFVRKRGGEPHTVWPWAAVNKPRLRLGFVSGDLRMHPVCYLVEGLLVALRRNGFEIFAYHNHRDHDARTAVLRGCVDHWREVAELADEAMCELIRQDEIDVLCDLSGHTAFHRLEVFARRPAPCQFTWLGYHGGTGVPGMDAYLIDAEMAHGLDACYVEKLVDLPWAFNMAAHLLPDTRDNLTQAPYERNGYVTFGSLSNPIKFNEAVFDAWADILRRAETAMLVQRYRKFSDVGVVRAFKESFIRRGVAAERIHCLPALPREEALRWLAQNVDLGLDPFPYGAHTTAVESLAVGVPVLSVYGDRVAARVCAVFNRKLGLHDFVVDDVAAYVEQAVRLAQQPGDLAATRRLCRELTWRSPLVDSTQFAADFAQAVRQLVNGGQTTVSAQVNAASGKSRRS